MEVDVVEVTLTLGWPGAETGTGLAECPLQTCILEDQYTFIHSYRILYDCCSYCDYIR